MKHKIFMKHKIYRSIVYAIIMFIPCLLVVSSVTFTAYASEPKILMFLWQGETSAEKGFKDALAEELPNQKIEYTILDTYKNTERLNDLIDLTDETKYQLIYTYGSTVTSKIIKTFKNIPIVFDIVFDPIGYKIIDSWDTKQSNVTGVSNSIPIDILVKKMQDIFGVGDIGIIYNPLDKKTLELKEEIETCLHKLGVEILPYEFRENFDSLNAYLDSIRGRSKCIYLPTEYLVVGYIERIFGDINRVKIPSCVTSKVYLSRGGLIGITAEYYEVGKIAGKLTAKILKGTKPQDIPIQRPSISDITVYANSPLLKRLNITLPKELEIKYIN